MSALKDSFVGKVVLPTCGEHGSDLRTTEEPFLGLERVNYESTVRILLNTWLLNF